MIEQDNPALSQARHLIVTAMENCPDAEYPGLEKALEIIDEYRETLQAKQS